MPNPETAVDQYLMRYISSLDPWRIEDACNVGVMDINHTHGWVEVKQLKEWPKREETIVKFPKFTKRQRDRLRHRIDAGGICHVFVRIKNTNMLFDGLVASKRLGYMTKDEMYLACQLVWGSGTGEIGKNDPRLIGRLTDRKFFLADIPVILAGAGK